MVSVTTVQLCHGSTKAARDNIEMNGHGGVPIKLYFQRQRVGWMWPTGHRQSWPMYAPLSSGSFRAKAAWPAAGKLNQRKQQEGMCFPRCCALSWPKLYLARIAGKERKGTRSKGGMAGLSQTQDHLLLWLHGGKKQSVLHLSRETQHSYPPDLYDDPEAHQFIARTHLFGAWDQMRKWDQGRERKEDLEESALQGL